MHATYAINQSIKHKQLTFFIISFFISPTVLLGLLSRSAFTYFFEKMAQNNDKISLNPQP